MPAPAPTPAWTKVATRRPHRPTDGLTLFIGKVKNGKLSEIDVALHSIYDENAGCGSNFAAFWPVFMSMKDGVKLFPKI